MNLIKTTIGFSVKHVEQASYIVNILGNCNTSKCQPFIQKLTRQDNYRKRGLLIDTEKPTTLCFCFDNYLES